MFPLRHRANRQRVTFAGLLVCLVVGVFLVSEHLSLTALTRSQSERLVSLQLQERMLALLELEAQVLQASLESDLSVDDRIRQFEEEFRGLAVRLGPSEVGAAKRVIAEHQKSAPALAEFLELRQTAPGRAREVLALRLLPELQKQRTELLAVGVRPLRDSLRITSARLEGRLGIATLVSGGSAVFALSCLAWLLWPERGGKRVSAPRLEDPNFESSLPLSFTQMALAHARSTGSGSYPGTGYTEKVLRSLSNLLVFTAPDGSIRRVNEAVCRTLGYDSEELLGEPMTTILGSSDGDEAASGTRNVEVDYVTKSGQLVPMLVSCSAVFHDDGSVNGMVVIAQDISERKAVEEALRASEARLRLLMERLVTAQEEERRKAARDLHDGMLQLVIAAELQLTAFRKTAKGLPNDEMLASGVARLKESVQEGRRLINNLRPPTLDQFGLSMSLRQEVEKLGRELGCEVSFKTNLSEAVPAAMETTLFRIAQEAMNNIRKHAKPEFVNISLLRDGSDLEMEVADRGVGFNMLKVKKGVGLGSMQERAELLGGSCEVSSEIEGGTRVFVCLPYGKSVS